MSEYVGHPNRAFRKRSRPTQKSTKKAENRQRHKNRQKAEKSTTKAQNRQKSRKIDKKHKINKKTEKSTQMQKIVKNHKKQKPPTPFIPQCKNLMLLARLYCTHPFTLTTQRPFHTGISPMRSVFEEFNHKYRNQKTSPTFSSRIEFLLHNNCNIH